MSSAFDSLACFEKLKESGVPENQARAQAEILRSFADTQAESFKRSFADREAGFATKAALKELEIKLIKWQIGIGATLVLIMAKGFGWIGF